MMTPSGRFGLCVLFALSIAGCTTIRSRAFLPAFGSEWILKGIRQVGPEDLWQEHRDGGNLYIQNGCAGEILGDFRHRTRPWMIRSSVFDQSTPEGARALFDQRRRTADAAPGGLEILDESMYLMTAPDLRSWIIGFSLGKYFVEATLTEEADPEQPMDGAAREALLDFAQRMAATLETGTPDNRIRPEVG